jgi:hypothetical protein
VLVIALPKFEAKMPREPSESIRIDSIDPIWTVRELLRDIDEIKGRSDDRGNWFRNLLTNHTQIDSVTARIAKELAASGGTNGVDSVMLFAGHPCKVRSRDRTYETSRDVELAMVERILHAAGRVDEYDAEYDIPLSKRKEAAIYLFRISAISQLNPYPTEDCPRTYIEDLVDTSFKRFDLRL